VRRRPIVRAFDAILDRVDADVRDRVCRSALDRRLTRMLGLPVGLPERGALTLLVGRFVERTCIDARAFERILGAKDDALAESAARSVELASSSQGRRRFTSPRARAAVVRSHPGRLSDERLARRTHRLRMSKRAPQPGARSLR
jgi:hypothetical protein